MISDLIFRTFSLEMFYERIIWAFSGTETIYELLGYSKIGIFKNKNPRMIVSDKSYLIFFKIDTSACESSIDCKSDELIERSLYHFWNLKFITRLTHYFKMCVTVRGVHSFFVTYYRVNPYFPNVFFLPLFRSSLGVIIVNFKNQWGRYVR